MRYLRNFKIILETSICDVLVSEPLLGFELTLPKSVSGDDIG